MVSVSGGVDRDANKVVTCLGVRNGYETGK